MIGRICQAPGCERAADYGRRECSGHRARMKSHGTYGSAEFRKPTPAGLDAWGVLSHNGWTAVVRVPDLGECHEYDGPRFARGYGQVKSKIDAPNPKLAHRVSYEHHFGPIPDGLIVRHKCDNPPCINPDHLELGTSADNARDRKLRGRGATGEKSGMAKLSDADVIKLRAIGKSLPNRLHRGPALRRFAESVSVSYAAVQSAWLRSTFRHLPGGYKWED